MPAVLWLALAALLCIGEALSLDLVLLMLAGASLAGGATALFTDSLPLQAGVASVAALVLLQLVRPVVRRHLEVPALLTGRDRLPGRTALVVEPVSRNGGQVRLDGELWRARPCFGCPDVPAGSQVVVASVEGATLQVYAEELS